MTGVTVNRAALAAFAVTVGLGMLASDVRAESPQKRERESKRAIDLRLSAPPVDVTTMKIRRRAPRVATAEPAATGTSAAQAAAVGADTSGSVDISYRAVPTSMRDIQERVIFKLNVGVGIDNTGTSGEVANSGFAPDDITDPDGNAFTDNRQYLLGNAVVGTRGILLPTLNTYFLSRYRFDADGASAFAGLSNVYDIQGGRELQVHAGYAEIDGLKAFGMPGLHIRGGRQFRYGSSMFVTKFDGISGGYAVDAGEAYGFFGRRASVFFGGDNPGLVGGGGVKVDLEEVANLPLDVAADYLFFDGGGELNLGDINADGEDDFLDLSRQYIELRARVKLDRTRITVSGRLADKGEFIGDPRELQDGDEQIQDDGLGLGRLAVQVRHPLSPKYLLVADVEQKFEGGVSYDYINPIPVDVINVSQQVGIGLDPPQNATRVGARLSAALSRTLEGFAFARVNITGDEGSGFYRNYGELGGAASTQLMPKLTATGQYKLRITQLEDASNDVGSPFDDTAGSGVKNFQELSAEARYSLGYKKLTAGVGGYVRVYTLESPYAEVTDDLRSGGRVDFETWVARTVRVKVAGEAAQPSPTFARELGTLLSVRGLMEVQF